MAKKRGSRKSRSKKAAEKPPGPADTAVGKAAPKPAPKAARARARTSEKAVGTKNHPANKAIPRKFLVARANAALAADSAQITPSPEVKGDKSVMVFDVLHKRPVEVFLIEGANLDPEKDGRLIFVQGDVSNGLMTAQGAKSKFAVQPDGTAIYNARGFDDVPGGTAFDFLDIAALIESKN